jgi:hypothetical protein
MLFRSKVMPSAFLPPAFHSWAIVPLQAVILPLPVNDPSLTYIGTEKDPKGVICSLDQYDIALAVKERSPLHAKDETSLLDVVYFASGIFTIFGLAKFLK